MNTMVGLTIRMVIALLTHVKWVRRASFTPQTDALIDAFEKFVESNCEVFSPQNEFDGYMMGGIPVRRVPDGPFRCGCSAADCCPGKSQKQKPGDRCACSGECVCGLMVDALFGKAGMLHTGCLVTYVPDYGDPVSAYVVDIDPDDVKKKIGTILLRYRNSDGQYVTESAHFDTHGAKHTWHHDVLYSRIGCTCITCDGIRRMA